jgi:plasmid maintenance system antidote protein VapI
MTEQRFPEFNSAWFKEQMQKHDLTYSDIANVLEVTVKSARSVAHKVMNGDLKLTAQAAVALSKKFGVPLETVLKEAGQLPAEAVVPTKEHKVEQSVLFKDGQLLQGRQFPRTERKAVRVPPGIPEDGLIVKFGDPNTVFSGWTAYCGPMLPLKPAMLDKLVITQTGPVGSDEPVVMGKLRRGSSRAGYYIVEMMDGQITPEFKGTVGAEVYAIAQN